MSNYRDNNTIQADHPRARLVFDAIAEMHRSRAEFRQYQAFDDVPESVHRVFEGKVLSVYDELRSYKKTVKKEWDELGLDYIPAMAEKSQRVVDSDGQAGALSGPSATESVERVPIEPRTLIEFSYRLDDCAYEMGFSPRADLGREKPYKVMNPEDYDEPVKDTIRKPQ